MLAKLLRDHRGQLIADLHRFHGIALSRIRSCGLRLHEIAAIAANLPPEGAVWSSIRGQSPEDAPLGLELLRTIEYRLQELNLRIADPEGKSSHQIRPMKLPWDDPDPLWEVDALDWDDAVELYDDERFKEALDRVALTL